jgi:hypothetical protein
MGIGSFVRKLGNSPDDRASCVRFPRRVIASLSAQALRALKKLSLAEQLQGKPGSMSQMVRDALDDYLNMRASES